MFPLSYSYRHQVGTKQRHLPQVAGREKLSAGFSLVEIMVGMVIGLLGMIVVMQMFSVYEGQRRTTTGGDDAQNNGAIALYGLQRDIRQAGYGVNQVSLFNCNTTISGVTVPLAPVTINPATAIIPAGDLNTDRLLVFYGNTNGIPEGNLINSQAGNVYSVQMPASFQLNDIVIAAPTTCGATNLVIDRIAAAPALTTVTVASIGATGSNLYNLGQAPQVLAYAIRNGNLTVCDYLAKNCGDATKTNDPTFWLPIATDIVSMKMQYGRDTLSIVRTQAQIDAIVNATTPPTPRPSYIVDTYDQTTPTAKCGWTRIPAVRLALVARNVNPDKSTSGAAPAWAGSATAPINLTATAVAPNFTWQNYRYKVFQTTISIRNVAWMGVQSGC